MSIGGKTAPVKFKPNKVKSMLLDATKEEVNSITKNKPSSKPSDTPKNTFETPKSVSISKRNLEENQNSSSKNEVRI